MCAIRELTIVIGINKGIKDFCLSLAIEYWANAIDQIPFILGKTTYTVPSLFSVFSKTTNGIQILFISELARELADLKKGRLFLNENKYLYLCFYRLYLSNLASLEFLLMIEEATI